MTKPKPYRLLVVAHPDDETLFFGGLLITTARKGPPWKVICVTDGNADGHGQARRDQFRAATRAMAIKDIEHWDFPDVYEQRLDVTRLTERLRALPGKPREVYTHGVLGEYGHPHHQDVCAAVFKAFGGARVPVWSAAYNCFPEKTVKLTAAQYRVKCRVLADIYRSETRRFAHFLPSTAVEGFIRLAAREVEAIYAYLCGGRAPDLKALRAFKWYWPYLEGSGGKVAPRPF
jgi:LmbE family N-acetylglucosaminyl deacetylase